MNKGLIIGSFVLLFIYSGPLHAKRQAICGPYVLEAGQAIEFSSNEIKLICGDEEVNAWRRIPVTQAQYSIRNFLQNHGYFFPEFIPQKKQILVRAGSQTIVRAIEVPSTLPRFFKIKRKRHIRNKELTPSLLDELGRWTRTEFRSHGYPCPVISPEADARSGVITLKVDPGPFQRITRVTEQPVKNLNTKILRRYDAFEMGQPYDYRWLTLTADRTHETGMLQHTYFSTECTPEGAHIRQRNVPGKPRLIQIGVGADTEEYGKMRVSWKNARMGRMGSTLRLTGYGSYREQSFEAESEWYLLSEPSRWHLNPFLSVRREDESKYEILAGDIRFPAAVSVDTETLGMNFIFGPSLNYTNTYRGPGEGLARFLQLHSQFTFMSHDFEFYRTDPRSGFTTDFQANLSSGQIFSTLSAQQLKLSGQSLWNVAKFDPPLLVLGIRGGLATTIANPDSPRFERLPASFRYYLGGSRDLRGFSRTDLPRTGDGALTAAFVGTEARLGGVLPLKLQPLVLADVGFLGARPLSFDWPLFVSPGFGIRYPSPIGVFRTTLSKGIMVGPENENAGSGGWQFYFSFGEEF